MHLIMAPKIDICFKQNLMNIYNDVTRIELGVLNHNFGNKWLLLQSLKINK